MIHQKADEVLNNILKYPADELQESLSREINKGSVNVYAFCHDVEAPSIFKKII